MIKRALPVLLALTLLAPAQAAFVSSEYGFSASAPKGWKQVSYPGVLVAFASPTVTGRFANNVNITVENIPAGFTLEQYIQAGQVSLKRVITNFKPLGSRSVTLGGLPAQQQEFSGRQGEFDLYFSQTIALKSGHAYVLTGTSLLPQKATLAPSMAEFVQGFKFSR
ncbi:DcrB-related protein [Deinococcus sp.]|uniref:DcrB-related protein n=1 Tax=Deinococcus sp. TaxID=47478 RepID=UPI003C7A9215